MSDSSYSVNRDNVMKALFKGEIELQGQFLSGSNYTFLGKLNFNDECTQVVYKPIRGEQPLWDFPHGSLARREVAAYLISEALGWELVPPTILRKDGPLGPGSLQQYIEHNPNDHYFNYEDKDRQRLRPVALFDLILNNADRKGGHILRDTADHIWLIDHGLCFHTEDKLRTVIWDYAGDPIPESLRDDVRHLTAKMRPGSDLVLDLAHLLRDEEIVAMRNRATRLVETGCFPMPPTDRRVYPWPPV